MNSIFCEVFGFDNVTLSPDPNPSGTNIVDATPINTATQLRGTRHYAFIPHFSLNAARVRLSFGGSGRVYQVALTRQLLNLSEAEFTSLSHRRTDEGAERRVNVNGNAVVIPGRAGRWKWRTELSLYIPPGSTPTADQVIDTLDRSPNLFVYPQPEDEPTRFYPASLSGASFGVDYLGDLTTQKELSFTLQEL